MNEPHYRACRLLFDAGVWFVAWYWADRVPDGFLRDRAGRLVVADDPRSFGVRLDKEWPADYDFDRIRAWCAGPDVAGVDCAAFLDAWNFFDDLTGLHAGADSDYVQLSRAAGEEYGKLFYGNNLAPVTPPGERYTPSWAAEELAAIARVLAAGLSVLRAELAPGVAAPLTPPSS